MAGASGPRRPAAWFHAALRAAIIGAACAGALALSGCSAMRLAYGQGPTLGYWWLDAYVDFNASQSQKVRDALDEWFAWHRRTQLPDYAELLVRGEAEALVDTTPERACEWWADLSRRVEAAAEHAIPLAAGPLLTLTPTQLDNIETRYQKLNAEYRDDFLQPDLAERRRESVKRAIERAEELYGRLDEAQRARVARMTIDSPFDPETWLAERRQRQQDALQMMRRLIANAASAEQAQVALRTYFNGIQRSPRDAYRRYSDRLTQYNCMFSATLHNSTTPAQRQRAAQKVRGWEADVRSLAADAS